MYKKVGKRNAINTYKERYQYKEPLDLTITRQVHHQKENPKYSQRLYFSRKLSIRS